MVSETQDQIEARLKLEGRLKSGANWFYWLAALSLVNSIIVMADGSWTFLFGLGIAQVVDGFVVGFIEEMPNSAVALKSVGFGLVLLISGFFIMLGWLANQRKRWAFLVGLIIYGIDALILVMFGDFLGFAFHFWVGFGLLGGLRALGALTELDIAPVVTCQAAPQAIEEYSPPLPVNEIEGDMGVVLQSAPEVPIKLKQSGLGIASFSLSLIVFVAAVGLLVAAVMVEGSTGKSAAVVDREYVMIGMFGMFVGILNLVALGLGISGLVQKGRKRLFAILGTVFSCVGILLFVLFAVLGTKAG